MSSCQDYASRRPQEPWKYLDIYFAPPLVCSAIQCIIFCGCKTRFQVARGRTLKGRSCIFFLLCDCISTTQQEQIATASRHRRFFFINPPSVPCSLSLLEHWFMHSGPQQHGPAFSQTEMVTAGIPRQCYMWWKCSWKHEKILCNCFLL